MPAIVTNHNYTNHFATCIGNVLLERGMPRLIENDQAVEELKRFPYLTFEMKPVPVKPVQPGPVVRKDISGLPINTLRRMAARAGIKGSITMKKARLINLLGDKT